MNQGELEMLVQRLHGADEIITEQQLGLKYSANEKDKNVKHERKVYKGRLGARVRPVDFERRDGDSD
eukprot:TRINITY_DN7077_c0_g1_i1.p4 TRINITY_DN7077_c0_g1~~TRINITY_DN7077_c0_g1_i1.p4  ORF type:complete len:67 (+),score=1.16 TRINITY_DN7077_c0_g1_i1:542-742(+)